MSHSVSKIQMQWQTESPWRSLSTPCSPCCRARSVRSWPLWVCYETANLARALGWDRHREEDEEAVIGMRCSGWEWCGVVWCGAVEFYVCSKGNLSSKLLILARGPYQTASNTGIILAWIWPCCGPDPGPIRPRTRPDLTQILPAFWEGEKVTQNLH